MKLTKSQLKKIIQEELASVREEVTHIPREVLARWIELFSELISAQFQGGKGLPLRQLPSEDRPTIIAALEDVIDQLKTEPFSEAFDSSSDFAQKLEDAFSDIVVENKRQLAQALMFNIGPDKTKKLLETLNTMLEAANSRTRIAAIELTESE
jgi:hypothetical protein